MPGENAEQMGCPGMTDLHILHNVALPDWLLTDLLTEVNLGFITSSKINEWAINTLTPLAASATGRCDISLCTSHVHVGDTGVEPHDHLPHEFTSVVFLTNSLGELVMHLPDGSEKVIVPEEGKMVLFPASWIHYVRPSPEPELRVTFVSNYEFQAI